MDFSWLNRSVALSGSIYTVPFLIGVAKGRNTWLCIILYCDIISGLLWTFMPHAICATQMKAPPDDSLNTFGRAVGAVFFYLAALVHYCRLTGDKVMLSSLFLTQFIGCSLHLVASVYNLYLNPEQWHVNENLMGTYGLVLLAAGTVIFYVPLRTHGGHTQLPSVLNSRLRLNGILILLCGITFYAFPEIFVKLNIGSGPFDARHLYFVRLGAGYVVAHGILSLLSPGFLFEADKKAVVKAQIVGISFGMLAILYAALAYEGWGNPVSVGLFLLLDGSILANAFFVLHSPPETTAYKSD